MNIETIKVEANGKFGPKVNGVFYSFSKFFKGEKQLPLNVPINVDVYVSEGGKKYINSIVSGAEAVSAPSMPIKETPAQRIPEPKMAVDQSVWDKKDRSQLVGGRSHDAASLVNTALVTGTELSVVLDMYEEALKEILAIEVK